MSATSYCHLASAGDDLAIETLQAQDFFKHYTEKTRQLAGGEVATPIELIAETASGVNAASLRLFHQSRSRQRTGDDGPDIDATALRGARRRLGLANRLVGP